MTDWHVRFRAARKAAGFSASAKLAAEVGASPRQVIRWETGDGVPSEKFRHAIAGLSSEFAALILELESEPESADLERLIRRTVISVLHEIQFPRLEALEAQFVQRGETLERGFAHLEEAIERLADQLPARGRRRGSGGSPE